MRVTRLKGKRRVAVRTVLHPFRSVNGQWATVAVSGDERKSFAEVLRDRAAAAEASMLADVRAYFSRWGAPPKGWRRKRRRFR